MNSPVPFLGPADYRTVLRRLTSLDEEAAAHRAEAARWHDGRVAAADDAVRAAEENVRAAEREVQAARRNLEEIDARAAGLWSDFVHKVGPTAERFGKTVPEPTVPRQRDRDPEEFLKEAATTAGYTPPPRPLTGATKLMFGTFGFIGGTIGVAAAQVLRWAGTEAGGDWANGLPVLALIVLLLGPVLAVFGAKRVADRRSVALDPAAVATVLISGLVTAGVIFAGLR
jgi:hypothetical protein